MGRARATVLSALGVLAACNPMEMSRAHSAADDAVTGFHAQYNAGRFGEITSAVGDEFPAGDRDKFEQLLAAVRRKLGNETSTKNQGWNVRSMNLRTNVQLVQATTFERGSGVETFAFVVSEGKARLVGYNINSQDLILR